MLTRSEAEERADRIWPNWLHVDPGARPGEWYIVDVKGDDHYIDGNGHPTCHNKCKRIEEALP